MHVRFYIIIKYFSRLSLKYTTMSHILELGSTFAVLTMSSILQIMVSWENYFMQFHLKTCRRSEKYIKKKKKKKKNNKAIPSHRLVNN